MRASYDRWRLVSVVAALGLVLGLWLFTAAPLRGQSAEVWELAERIDNPALRGNPPRIQLQRIAENEVAYIWIEEAAGVRWVSVLAWDDPVPIQVGDGDEIRLQTRARWDIREGTGGGGGRISATADTVRPGVEPVFELDIGRADPDGFLGGPAATARWQLALGFQGQTEDLRINVYVGDGGSVRELVTTYVYRPAAAAVSESQPIMLYRGLNEVRWTGPSIGIREGLDGLGSDLGGVFQWLNNEQLWLLFFPQAPDIVNKLDMLVRDTIYWIVLNGPTRSFLPPPG